MDISIRLSNNRQGFMKYFQQAINFKLQKLTHIKTNLNES